MSLETPPIHTGTALRVLFRRQLRDGAWLMAPCAVGVFLFCWLHVVVNSQVDMSLLKVLLDRVPDFVENLAPVPFKELMTYPVRLAMAYEEPMLQILMAVWCIARASDVVAGEIGRGTMELLLSQPIRRSWWLGTSTAVTLLGVLVISVASWGGSAVGIATSSVEQKMYPFLSLGRDTSRPLPGATTESIPMSLYVTPAQLLPCFSNYFALGVFVSGVGTLASVLDRHRWRVIGFVSGYYIVSQMTELLGRQLPRVHWLQYFSFLKAYDPARCVSAALKNSANTWSWLAVDGQGHIMHVGILTLDVCLVLAGVACLLIATWRFRHCDIAAPI